MSPSKIRCACVVAFVSAGVVMSAACVGDNSSQIDAGDGSTADTTTIDTSADIAADNNNAADAGGDASDAAPVTITDISAGEYHACALASNGAVYCWGENAYGEVGAATSKNKSCTGWNSGAGNIPIGCITAPNLVSGLTATKVVAGGSFTCAIDSAGDVWCWGANWANQLGHGTGVGDSQCTFYAAPDASAPYACNATPTKVAGVSNVADLALGADHACARTTTNAVYCWGDNTYGQLGNTGAGTSTPTPTQPTGLPPVIEVRAGYDLDTCAVTVAGGAVWCWGNDDWGQLDVPNAVWYGSLLLMKTPAQAVWADGGAMTGANHISLAHAYSCATFGSNATCWGLNYRNIVPSCGGSGCGPTPIVGNTATGLEMRWESQCTLTGNRTCWGANSAGTLGDGTYAPAVQGTPEALASPPNVAKLSAGIDSFIALTTTGDVYAWGGNYTGMLGHAQGSGSPADTACAGTYCNATPQKVSGLP